LKPGNLSQKKNTLKPKFEENSIEMKPHTPILRKKTHEDSSQTAKRKLTKAENNIDYYVIMLHIYTHYTAYKHLLIFRVETYYYNHLSRKKTL